MDAHHHQPLHDLLVELSRSLLQYCEIGWAWTDEDGLSKQTKIDELIAGQKGSIAELVQLLIARSEPIDFGVFPDYSNLNFLSMDFFLGLLQKNQQALVTQIEDAIVIFSDDPAVQGLLTGMLDVAKNTLQEIDTLAGSTAPSS